MSVLLSKMIHDLFFVLKMILPSNYLEEIIEIPENELYLLHYRFGIYLRNNILNNESKLFEEFINSGIKEKDEMSSILIKIFHKYLHSTL